VTTYNSSLEHVSKKTGHEGVVNPGRFKAHTDRTRFGNATRIFSLQKQIKPSTDKKFTRYADQIAKIASVVPTISKTLKNIEVKCH
jgi:hypothetical protein